MDSVRLTTLGESIIVGAGGLLFSDAFLPWFSGCTSRLGFSNCSHHTGWTNPLSVVAACIALAMAIQAIASALSDADLETPTNRAWGFAHLGGAVVVLLLVIVQLVVGDGAPLGAAYGLYLALGLAVVLVGGAAVRSRED